MAISSTTVNIPLFGGLNQKSDARVKGPPSFDILRDAQFDSIGALQTRYPYLNIGTNIFGGGTLANIRRIVVNGSELLCFTVDTLYSWNAQLSVWVNKGTHLAVAVDEQTVAQTTSDQFACDMATLDGVTVYVWLENRIPPFPLAFYAAFDEATGSMLVAPTFLDMHLAGSDLPRIRIVALQTKFLVVFNAVISASLSLACLAIDPANVASSFLASFTQINATGGFFDVAPVIGSDSAVLVTPATTSDYKIYTITSALSIASSTKARTCDTAIGVACSPDGLHAMVIRTAATSVLADMVLISSLADVFVSTVIGATTSADTVQIACAFQSVKSGGHYPCWVWWTVTDVTIGAWVDDGGSTGAGKTINLINLASRAFDYNGNVYVWAAFQEANGVGFGGHGGSLQNTYYLVRSDGFMVAKAAAGNAAGAAVFTSSLPGVSLIGANQYAWVGSVRRIVDVTNAQGYGSRAPRNITFTFDDQSARRCVRLGRTLYIAGGMILQYDGAQLVELGWPIEPWTYTAVALGSGGNLSAGGYGLKCSYRWDNAQGERDRSSTTCTATLTCAANDTIECVAIGALTLTRKVSSSSAVVALEVWRTLVSPASGSPFYLVSSPDPSTQGALANGYQNNANATAGFFPPYKDELADTSISVLENNPENGGVLSNDCPPAARVIFANDTRIFLGDIAGLPDAVWYSQQRNDGEVVKFSGELTIQVPAKGGRITAIRILPTGAVVVFRETATYIFEGVGFDNTGNGQNYQLTRTVAEDIGAQNQESVALLDTGLLFKSNKGWYQLDLSQNLTYVGQYVSDYDGETVVSMQVMTAQHQVRILSANRPLIFDWFVGLWGEWTIGTAFGDAANVSSDVWNGQHVYTDGTGIYQQQTSYASGVNYGMDVETAWIKMADLQGDGRVRRILFIGEYRGAHALRWRVARDYVYDGSGNVVYMDDVVWPVTPTTIGSVEQCAHGPSYQQCEAIKVRLTAVDATVTTNPPSGEALRMTGLALKLAVRPTPYPRLPATQKV